MEQSSIICPHCQTPNPARNLYCQSCGKPLIQAAPFPPQAPAPAEASPNPTPLQPPTDPTPPAPGPMAPPQGFPPQPGYPPQGPQGYPQPGLPPQQPQGYPPQGVPPQPAYYPPPPPAPKPPAAPTLEQLGVRIDGWADLIPGAGDQAEAVQKGFVEGFTAREIPDARLEQTGFSSAGIMKPYWVVRKLAESSVVQIEPKGKDLWVSWSQYARRPLDMQKLGILVGAAFAVSFFEHLGVVAGNFGYFLLGWIFGTLNWLLPVTIIALVAGYIWKGSFWYFFMPEPDEMAKDERTALMLAVHQSLLGAVQKAGFETDELRDNGFWVSSRDRKI